LKKNTINNYKIIKYKNKHLQEVVKLYSKSYGKTKPLKYFKYRLSKSLFGKPIIFLMHYHKQIVGFYAIQPIKLKINNQNILAGYSYLTMTHPDHGDKRIFTKLAIRTYAEAKKKNYKFIFTFANANSFPGFIKKLDFKELKRINFIKIKKIKYDIISHPQIRENYFPFKLDKLWQNYESKNKFKIRIERNDSYLKWRYLKHPLFHYITVYKPNEYFFIFKKYKKTLHIIDFFGKENDTFYINLLSTAKNLTKKFSCRDITFWISQRHKINRILKKPFIEKLESQSFFLVKILDKRFTKSIFDIKNWYYTMGDSDVF